MKHHIQQARVGLLSGLKQFLFIFLFLSDIAMFALGIIIASVILNQSASGPSTQVFLFTMLILVTNYTHKGLYKDKRNLFDENEFMSILYSIITTFVIITVFILLFEPTLMMVALFLIAFMFTLVLTALSRLMIEQIVYFFRRRGYDLKKVVFFGTNADLYTKIKENKFLGYSLIKKTGDLTELKDSLARADTVFITDPITEPLMDIIIENDKINWKIISSAFNLIIDPVSFDEFKDYPILNVRKNQSSRLTSMAKRGLDIILSAGAIVILSPLFAMVAMLIKLTMPGPVFFRQERIGKHLKPFMIFKFRSMRVNANAGKSRLKNEVNGLFKMKNDPRVTPFGRFLRRSCIDELPQIFNIFLGDMSIVGPRPHLRKELKHFSGWRRQRFRARPGLTGMWQVNGRHELNFDKAILYDIYYIRNKSLLLDFLIVLKTIPSIIFSKGRF